jgi:hypothetical protein
MIRYVTLILLLVFGVMLAFNVGRSLSILSTATTRNPATIAVTSFLAERGPPQLLALEQHDLHYLMVSPYALLSGLFASLALGPSRAIAGVLFWAAFATTFAILLCLEGARWDGLSWYSMIPDAIGSSCTVPIYVVGLALGCSMRQRARPRHSLLDLLVATTVAAMILAIGYTSSGWIPPIGFLLVSVFLAWRLYARPTPETANHPMQPSGEVGRFEIDDRPSPPADR